MMRAFKILSCGCLLTVLALTPILIPSTVSAGEPRAHDGGFFLRLSGGGGYASTSLESGGEKLELSGTSGDLNFAVGGVVANNLALHGTLWGWLTSDPDAKIDGTTLGTVDGNVDLSAVGGGLTYYLMPVNIYMSGSIGPAWLTIDNLDILEMGTGFALDITLGKEWWVGGSWGLGLAGAFGYYSVPIKGFDEKWTGTSFAVRFSATMN